MSLEDATAAMHSAANLYAFCGNCLNLAQLMLQPLAVRVAILTVMVKITLGRSDL